MSAAIVFDTHRFVKNLTASGFTEAQAEALAHEQIHLLEANLATNSDIAAVKAGLKSGLRPELDTFSTDLKSAFDSFRTDIKFELDRLKYDLLKLWVAGLIAQTVVIAALLQFLV